MRKWFLLWAPESAINIHFIYCCLGTLCHYKIFSKDLSKKNSNKKICEFIFLPFCFFFFKVKKNFEWLPQQQRVIKISPNYTCTNIILIVWTYTFVFVNQCADINHSWSLTHVKMAIWLVDDAYENGVQSVYSKWLLFVFEWTSFLIWFTSQVVLNKLL